HLPNPLIYPLSLHDALPIYDVFQHLLTQRAKTVVVVGSVEIVREDLRAKFAAGNLFQLAAVLGLDAPFHSHDAVFDGVDGMKWRSEEHTSELQSRFDLVCRL